MKAIRLLAVFMAAGLLFAACSDSDSDGDGASSDTAEESSSAGELSSDDTVVVASSDELGQYLVDGEGRTLYLFEKDDGTTTACTGGCADNWPPLIAESPTGGDGVDAADLSTADGISPNQVTYNGHLLYYFSGDAGPGETNGTSVDAWFAVSPSGDAIS